MRAAHAFLAGLTAIPLIACAGVGTPASHAQDAMSSLAENERFGRLELVMQNVAPKERAEFVKRHNGWGGRITIADTELGGFSMPDDDHAEMNMRVTWYTSTDQELRSTLIHQKWESIKSGEWLLTSEERVDGDMGLLGEKIDVQSPTEALAPAPRFATIRIGGD